MTEQNLIISIHAPRAGSDGNRWGYIDVISSFQSTLPVRGATRISSFDWHSRRISIHAPRAGSDSSSSSSVSISSNFNPRSPCGERLKRWFVFQCLLKFQSTLPVRGATKNPEFGEIRVIISIHAPRAGSDIKSGLRKGKLKYFNPRSPCGERLKLVGGELIQAQFQSTLPVRGATLIRFNERRNIYISIHAPRAGSDMVCILMYIICVVFQSTLPVRGATLYRLYLFVIVIISIHAPRAGSDLYLLSRWIFTLAFQSTLPVRGATTTNSVLRHISRYFNPRSPCGERQRTIFRISIIPYFNPRSPCGERLLKFESLFGFSNNSCMVIRFLAAPSSLL